MIDWKFVQAVVLANVIWWGLFVIPLLLSKGTFTRKEGYK